jgi:hypothetical protein
MMHPPRHRHDRRALAVRVALAAAVGASGCARSGPVTEPTPAAPTPPPAGDVLASPPDPSPAVAPADAREPTRVASLNGRPAWWLDSPRLDGDHVTLTVEARGASLREARRAAVLAASLAAERALGSTPGTFSVVRTAARATGEGQYLAYILAAATR